jgi:hypothetical protein
VLGSDSEIIYKDVPIDSWFAPYVADLVEAGVARGYNDEEGNPTGEFGVANSITRAEMLKMVLEAATKDLVLGDKAPDNRTARATWAAPYVRMAEDKDFVVFSENPDVHALATRGEVIQTLLEAMGIPTAIKLDPPFTDVAPNHTYAKAITVAAAYGLVEGDKKPDGSPTGTFRPDAPMNRAEVAKIIALAREVMSLELEE